MLLAGTEKLSLLSVTELRSIPPSASWKLTESRRGACCSQEGRVLSGTTCSPSLHRRQGASTGAATEHTSQGWETKGQVARVDELILKMGFDGSICCCSLDSSYNLEKDIKVFETLVSNTCYQLDMFQSPAELRRFPCSW